MDSGFLLCPPCVDERASSDYTGLLVAKDTGPTPPVIRQLDHRANTAHRVLLLLPGNAPNARHGSTASPFGH